MRRVLLRALVSILVGSAVAVIVALATTAALRATQSGHRPAATVSKHLPTLEIREFNIAITCEMRKWEIEPYGPANEDLGLVQIGYEEDPVRGGIMFVVQDRDNGTLVATFAGCSNRRAK